MVSRIANLLVVFALIIGVCYGEKVATIDALAKSRQMAAYAVDRYRQGQKDQVASPTGRVTGDRGQVYGHRGLQEARPRRVSRSGDEIKPVTNEMFLFWAPWCSGCPKMKTVARQIAAEGYKVTLVNTDDHNEMVRKYNIAQIPQTLIFELMPGESTPRLVKQYVGFVANNTIRKYLKKPDVIPPEPDEPDDTEESDYDIW